MNEVLQVSFKWQAVSCEVSKERSGPACFYLFHAPLDHLHADDRFPFSDQGSNLLLEPSAIPGVQYALLFRGIAIGPHEEIHGLVVANDHCWRAFVVNHIE